MSKQYWIMDPSETSIFISFESRGEAEDWMREKQAFITSETSILYQAKIVEMERQMPILDQLREVLGPAIKAARKRVSAFEKWESGCPFCGSDEVSMEKKDCKESTECLVCGVSCLMAHKQADDALIAAGLLLGVE